MAEWLKPFLLVRGAVEVHFHEIVDRTFDGRFPSDHLPVAAELGL
jgi:endonuclease/exonuclease/phosphatase family metal-dependent hydrolase